MAKGYRRSDKPPSAFFETIATAPAGGLGATGDDMGRFIRALINGGELDGIRILSKARLDALTPWRHSRSWASRAQARCLDLPGETPERRCEPYARRRTSPF